MALVIPSYVPLHRLPAASGLQLVFAGIFYFFVGPLVGTLINVDYTNRQIGISMWLFHYISNIVVKLSIRPGYVRDKTDYVTTLHFLNLCTYFVTICWLAERFYRNYQERSRKATEPDSLNTSAK